LTDSERLHEGLQALRSAPPSEFAELVPPLLTLAERVGDSEQRAEALIHAARLAHRQRRLDRSYRLADQAGKLARSTAMRARVAERLAAYHAAVGERERALQLHEQAAALFDEVGEAARACSARIDAIALHLERGHPIDLGPVTAEAEALQADQLLHKLGYFRMRHALRQGDLDEAIASCVWQQTRFPDRPQWCATAGLNLAVFRALRGELSEASEQLERAISALPQLIEVHVMQARIAARIGDIEAARELLDTLIRKRPDAGVRGALASYIQLTRIGIRVAEESEMVASDLVAIGGIRAANFPPGLPEGTEAEHWAERAWQHALLWPERWGRFTRLAALAVELLDPIAQIDTGPLRARLADARSRGACIPVGPWELETPLARGSQGEVWAATHLETGRGAAIKILLTNAPDHLRNEAAAVASLRHRGIVSLLDIGILPPVAEIMTEGALQAGTPWMAMELVDGGALTRHCGRLPWADVRAILRTLLDALAHAHARGVLHLDVKPQNVLLDARAGEVIAKLTDFGLTQPTEGVSTARIAGTPAYMSPEQARGEWRLFGPATDLYGLGCLAWQLVTGAPPFGVGAVEKLLDAHQVQPLPKLESVVAVPADLEDWLGRLLAKEPRERFPTAAHAATALARLSEPLLPPAAATSLQVHQVGTTIIEEGVEGVSTPGAAIPAAWMPLSPSYDVAERVERRPLSRLQLAPPRPPLTGRQELQATLWSHLSQVVATRRTRVVVLHGAEGVGVSAGARWLLERSAEQGARPLRLSATAPLEQGLKRWLRLDGLKQHARQRRIALSLEVPSTDPRVQQIDEASGAQVVDAMAVVTEHWARSRPVVLLVDDAHRSPWVLALIKELSGAVLVLLTVRSTDPDKLELPEGAFQIPVGPLADSAIDEALAHTLTLSPPLQARLLEAASGSIGFALGCVDRWLRHGSLIPGPSGLVLAAGHTLDGAGAGDWRQRFQEASRGAAEQQLVTLAATLGTPFHPSELELAAEALGLIVDCGAAVDHLVLEGLLLRDGSGLVRFGVTASQRALRSDTEELHAACAAAIPSSQPGRRAAHLLRCGQTREAAESLLRQAGVDLERGLLGAAAASLQGFEAAMERIDLGESDPLWEIAGEVREALGDGARSDKLSQ